jgi:hypothetical protein
MSLELVKESLKIRKASLPDAIQTVILNDIIVPDVNPDIKEILLTDSYVHNVISEVLKDRVLVKGVISCNILYSGEDDNTTVRVINSDNDFSCEMELTDAQQGMKSRARCFVEHIESEMINSRKLRMKSIVGIETKIINEIEGKVIFNLEGIEDAQILKQGYRINSFIGMNSCICPVSDVTEIPQSQPGIFEILKSNVRIVDKDIRITDNKVMVKGNVNVFALYSGDDEKCNIQLMEYELPFNRVLDMPGINEDSTCEVIIDIERASFTPEEDNDGELRLIKSDIELSIVVEANEDRVLDVIKDAYGLDYNLDIKRNELIGENKIDKLSYRISAKDMTRIEDENPSIEKILHISENASVLSSRISEGKLEIEGLARCNILYMTDDFASPVSNLYTEIPFSKEIEIKELKPDMRCDIAIESVPCEYNILSTKEVEVSFLADLDIKIYSPVVLPSIEKIDVKPFDDKRTASRPGIIVYFIQPDESIWDIAKRYRIEEDDIKRANNLEGDSVLEAGSQIIIPHRKRREIKV